MLKKNKKFKVACIQMNSQDNLDDNISFALRKVIQASKKGAKLILLPENCFLMAKNNKQILDSACEEKNHLGIEEVKKITKKFKVWVVIGSVNIKEKNNIFNRSVLINDKGKIVSRYNKIHLFSVKLPNKEIYNENKYFVPGKRISLSTLPWGKVGMTICYDLRFPNLYRKLAQKGAYFISIPAAFTKFTGELHWHTLLKARAIETGCYIFAPAQCGKNPRNKFTYGHSLIIDPWGKIIKECKKNNSIIIADVDTNKVNQARSTIPSLKLERFF